MKRKQAQEKLEALNAESEKKAETRLAMQRFVDALETLPPAPLQVVPVRQLKDLVKLVTVRADDGIDFEFKNSKHILLPLGVRK